MCEQMRRVGWHNCCISEMTVAELLYGAECSNSVAENIKEVLSFCADMEVIPIAVAISEYASQKARLRRKGTLIDDIDLFIGATAVAIDAVMVTENVKHLDRVENIRIENWASEK